MITSNIHVDPRLAGLLGATENASPLDNLEKDEHEGRDLGEFAIALSQFIQGVTRDSTPVKSPNAPLLDADKVLSADSNTTRSSGGDTTVSGTPSIAALSVPAQLLPVSSASAKPTAMASAHEQLSGTVAATVRKWISAKELSNGLVALGSAPGETIAERIQNSNIDTVILSSEVGTGGFQSIIGAAGADRGTTSGQPGRTTATPSTLDPVSVESSQTPVGNIALATAGTGVQTTSIEPPTNLVFAGGDDRMTDPPEKAASVVESISGLAGTVDPAAIDLSHTAITDRSATIIGSVSRSDLSGPHAPSDLAAAHRQPAGDDKGFDGADTSADAGSQPVDTPTAPAVGELAATLPGQSQVPSLAATQVQPPEEVRTSPKSDPKTQPTNPVGGPEAAVNSQAASELSRGPDQVAVRPLGDATIADNAGLSANLRVELADGQTAQATIREQAGSISVKIVTPTAQSALRVSGEIDSLRQNLDAAGVRLGNTEVSYQQGDRGGRNARDYRPTPQPAKSSEEKQPSTFSEVLK